MKITSCYFNTQAGSAAHSPCLTHLPCGSVTALHIKDTAESALDPDFGVGIDITLPDLDSYMANYRSCEFWCSPAFGCDLSAVPNETQCLIYKKKDGSFGVILPVVSDRYKCVLTAGPDGSLTAKLFSWYEGLREIDALALMYGEGSDPFVLLESCAAAALQLLGDRCKLRKERQYPAMLDYLGWCSWDAMQIRVNEADLLKKCAEFKKKNIPVKWCMIDDMWADVPNFHGKSYADFWEMLAIMHSSRLRSFEADPIRFPHGLKHCIDKIREYDIAVGMWHPTTGYWKGVTEDGPIAKELGDCLIKTPGGVLLPNFHTDRAHRFFSAFHAFLCSCGADFVKVDNQSMTRRFYKGLAPVGEVARQYHDGLEQSAQEHFDGAMINCMGTASEDMWNRKSSPVSRCSGDFMPEDAAWFRKHILQCSYNCLVQGQFYYCDWDMWWTDDGQAVKNSILRAVSGGPIYVSDQLERSRREVLMPLVLQDGRILRCDRPGMPTRDCLTVDPRKNGTPFKIQNTANGCGILAVFNLDENGKSVNGTVSPADIPGLDGDSFAVYEHFSRTLTVLKKDAALSLSLRDIDDLRLYVIAPIRDGFAVIGRTDKFISPKTVRDVRGRHVTLHEAGEYAVYEDGALKFRK